MDNSGSPNTPHVHAALDDLARIALADHSMESVMAKVAELSKRVVPGADEVSVTFVERGTPKTVAFTGQLALELDERQYEHDSGPCLAGIATGTIIEVPDMAAEPRWPAFTAAATERGCHSSLSVPIPLQREVAAALNVYSRKPHAFDADTRQLADTVAGYAGVAIANMHVVETRSKVAEQLQAAMQSRAAIEQAKGILMAQQRCTPDEAFAILVDLSQRSNRKLRDVAQSLVDGAKGTDGGP